MLGEVIRRSKTPDGMDIVLWESDFDLADNYSIMCYPVAQNTGSYGWVRRGETFCLTLDRFNRNAIETFFNLEKGKVKIRELWKYFWYPDRDAFYLGMINHEKFTPEEWEKWQSGNYTGWETEVETEVKS